VAPCLRVPFLELWIMNASENSPVSETSIETKPRKHDKRAVVVFFSFVAVLVLLVALNMK
jgi:hypothetical protein